MIATVVVAHPDDETIFFGGTIRRLARAGVRVEVVCATSTFASEGLTAIRRNEFRRACSVLGARARLLRVVDADGLLDETVLASELDRALVRPGRGPVLTHGVWGEYGHPHHIQVSLAVHRLTSRVWSLAGPFVTSMRLTLRPLELHAKRSLASAVYRSQPFAASWCSPVESYSQWTVEEAAYLGSLALGVRVGDAAIRPLTLADGFPDVDCVPRSVWQSGHAERLRRLSSS